MTKTREAEEQSIFRKEQGGSAADGSDNSSDPIKRKKDCLETKINACVMLHTMQYLNKRTKAKQSQTQLQAAGKYDV